MNYEEVSVATEDGQCRTFVFTPQGTGPWPAVIFFMDGLAIRPVLFDMCERLAGHGYVVALPDLFYRAGSYEPMDPKEVFAAPNFRDIIGPLMGTTDSRRAATDAGAVLEYLDSRNDVLGSRVGTTGYCMGGAISLTTAAMYPERIAAAASFHGGNLASDSEMSPHLMVSKIRGRVYVAGADQDDSYPPEMAQRLEAALTEAGVDHRCEIYDHALHGWTMADFPVYDQAAAERHWTELVDLFDSALK